MDALLEEEEEACEIAGDLFCDTKYYKLVLLLLVLEGYPLRGRRHEVLSSCLDQMLAVMAFSQHRVSSSKTDRP